ncbi:MAG: hypothetical protein IM624_10400 [Phenylobacterium sp.]|uniref:hypothetical protein n=1 Tax=Phenylobacterium sp. TaxID=1871053 RepID=UPI0025FBACDA|nr:hypothetical protein [Phenylobacterium sp.]MCA6299597.1 hypothetical protein [Phenylobacterium sp.]
MTDEILDEGPEEGLDLAEEVFEEAEAEAEPEVEAEEAEDDRSGWGEIEIDGEVYLTPPALKSAFLRQADYTRKTQELAEQRRRMEAEREAAGAHVAARARLHLLDEQARALEGLDWPALEAADPERARALAERRRTLTETRERAAFDLARREHETRLAQEAEEAEAVMATGRALAREIEGWSPALAADLADYARSFGVEADELRQINDPRLWRILHRAHLGETLARRLAEADRRAARPAVRPAADPGRPGGGAAGLDDRMETAEWMRRRNAAGLNGRRRPRP